MSRSIADVVGTLVFDENTNILQYTGIGKSRKSDIAQLAGLPFDSEGFAVVQDTDNNMTVNLYKKDNMTVVTYTKN